MEQIQRDGLARSIGISNFSTKSLQVILNTCTVSAPDMQHVHCILDSYPPRPTPCSRSSSPSYHVEDRSL
jgi:aryl-alcohol dehydrogenase-like predicted oxidoreductase